METPSCQACAWRIEAEASHEKADLTDKLREYEPDLRRDLNPKANRWRVSSSQREMDQS